MGSLKICDLCGSKAVLHCDADSAYLCWGCDAKVHGENFLVARHARIILSNSEDATNSLHNQPKSQHKKPMITRYSVAVTNSDMKVQAILRRWYRYLDLRSPSTLPLAMHLVEKGLNKLGSFFRQKWKIFLAASIWLASTHCENQAHLPSIKKVEECTGVPSELIVKVGFRMATILDWKIHDKEGWAESSS